MYSRFTWRAELQINGKRNGSKSQQDGAESPQTADYAATPAFESSNYGGNRSHQQSHVTPHGVSSTEDLPNGHRSVASTAFADQSFHLAEPSQDSPHQNAHHNNSEPSRQDAAGQPSHNRASQQQAGHPQKQHSVSSQTSGHPQLQGLSSRRRSMERQSASLTLPFEQLNFVFHHINYSVAATVSLSHGLVPSCNCWVPKSGLQVMYLRSHSVWKSNCIALAL